MYNLRHCTHMNIYSHCPQASPFNLRSLELGCSPHVLRSLRSIFSFQACVCMPCLLDFCLEVAYLSLLRHHAFLVFLFPFWFRVPGLLCPLLKCGCSSGSSSHSHAVQPLFGCKSICVTMTLKSISTCRPILLAVCWTRHGFRFISPQALQLPWLWSVFSQSRASWLLYIRLAPLFASTRIPAISSSILLSFLPPPPLLPIDSPVVPILLLNIFLVHPILG